MPIWLAPVGLLIAAGGFALFVATMASNNPPSLLWSRKVLLNPGMGVQLLGTSFRNNGSTPLELVPLNDEKTVVMITQSRDLSLHVQDWPKP